MISKIIIDQSDVESVKIALRTYAEILKGRTGASEKALAKRLEKYCLAIKHEPTIEADYIQQLQPAIKEAGIDHVMKYLPVLIVNGVITPISEAKQVSTKKQALSKANMYANMLRRNLKNKW